MPNKSTKTPAATATPASPAALADISVASYLDQLASGEPAPGGGAVVALMGAEAAALFAMAVRITGDQTESMDADDRNALLGRLDSTRSRLVSLADADAAAFRSVIEAYALPQSDESARAKRLEAVQSAYHEAVKVPLQVMAEIDDLFSAATTAAAVTKPSVASDIGIGIELLGAALKAGRYNIWINLKYIKDKQFAAGIEQSAAAHLEGKKALRQQLQKQIKKLLR